MKGIFVILLTIMMHVSVISFAQNITIKKQGVKMQTVFKEIRRQGKYDFLYKEELMKKLGSINVNITNASVEQVLDSVFLNLPLKYSIQDKVVMITAKDTIPVLQKFYSISGVVKDKKGQTLPGASVLIGNSKIGKAADNEGRFVIGNLSPGNYNVLVQMVGFLPATKNAIITNRSAVLEIVLDESVNLLKEVIIKPNKFRQFYLKEFKDSFIGTSLNAKKCEIINPDVIRFDYDTARHILNASANEFIIVENKALGYRISYLLKYFEKDEETNFVHFHGYPFFEEIEEIERKRKRYSENRRLAYLGSPQHFFWSLYNNTTRDEGFIINKLVKTPNHKKPSDRIVDEKIKFFSQNARKSPHIKNRKDSLKYWAELKKEPDTLEVLIRKEISTDSLVKQKSAPLKTVNFENALYIIFKGEKETADFAKYPEYKIKRPDDLSDCQISLVYQLTGFVGFYENGAVYDPGALLYEGVWAYKKVADMLPIDYTAPKKYKKQRK